MQEFTLEEFLSRSTDKPFVESDLSQVLEALPRLSSTGPWLGGGAIRRLLSGQDALASDLDFFFASNDQRLKFEADLLGIEGCIEVKKTEHHTEFVVPFGLLGKSVKVQCIHFQYYQNVVEVLDSFDFTICQVAFDGAKLFVGDYTLWDLARKRLALHKLTFGLSTVRRLLKYQTQGFYACSGVLTAILNDIGSHPEKINSDIKYVD